MPGHSGSGRRRPVALLVAGLLLTAAACGGGGGGGGGSGGGGGPSGSIVIGTTESLQNSFDPAQAYDYLGSEIVFNTAETLVTYEPKATEPSPKLAASMPDVSSDGLTYTFILRAGVKFADGTPFNAAAVKFSLERARDFGAKDPEAAGFLLSGIRSISAPSDDKVVISLSQPNVTFLSRLAYSVAGMVSPKAYAANVLTGGEDGPAVTAKYKTDTIVGTGPYRIVAYKERESVDLEANPDYWGPAPKTKRIRVRLFDKSSALKLALQNNEVDVAFRSLQPDENAFFKNRPGFALVEGEGSGIRYVVINVTGKPWDDPNLRRALAAAVNRKAVVDEVFKGSATALASMVPGTFPTSEPKWEQLYGANAPAPTTSTRGGPSLSGKTLVDKYLAAAGKSAGTVPVELWYSPTHYGDTEAAVAEVIARSLEDTKRFTVKVRNVEWAEYGKKRKAGEMPVFLMGWFPDYLDPDDYLEPFSDPNIFDPAKWNDPKMVELVHTEQRMQDPDQRAAALRSAQAYMADQVPYIPVFQAPQFAATSAKVSGVVLDPIQIFRYWLLEKRG
ncbi:MAG: peptide/nickel transport system substrate-binding protein [Actinomycetota bacterium]|nr:peptide/nickel transport system substrate-binding protein [Actinomycetota bacterium]